ncbi:MAG: GntR family transcriptional regulator [Oscillospiraceae bacterium]|nr:GntR family transcriptional regulator [Oscillospiraceae bacterium]
MAYSKSVAIASELRAQILNNEYKKGDKLPTESELSTRFGVSRQTIRKALADLSSENLITSVQGSGSYVAFEAPVRSKTMHITIITSYISEYIFPAILRGIDNTVSGAGYTVNVRATNNSIATERKILEDILEHPVDGIAVEGTKTTMPNPNIALYAKIADLGIPIVMFNNYYPGLENPGYPHVITRHDMIGSSQSGIPLSNIKHVVLDDYAGAYALTEKLIKEGHTKIGGIFKSDDMQGFVRYSGYLDCMLYHKAEFEDDNVIWYTTESGPRMIDFWEEGLAVNYSPYTALLKECTALICYNDTVAQLVLSTLNRGLLQANINALYSFDRHIDLHSTTGIETYSLGYPKDNIGELIGHKLLDMMNGKDVQSEMLAWTK